MIGFLAVGLAAVVGAAPASLAQDSSVSDPGKPAEALQRPGSSNAGISIAAPIGRVSVDPKSMEGEPVYVRRTTAAEGITIVEVSTTPFVPVLVSNGEPAAANQANGRPEAQPASW